MEYLLHIITFEVEKGPFFSISSLQLIEVTHVSIQWKPSDLEFAAPSHCFRRRVELLFWKEYLLETIIFQVDKGSFSSKWDYWDEFKKHKKLLKELHPCYKEGHLSHCCDLEFLASERNISWKSQFSRWRKAHFFQVGPLLWVAEAHVLSEHNHLC